MEALPLQARDSKPGIFSNEQCEVIGAQASANSKIKTFLIHLTLKE